MSTRAQDEKTKEQGKHQGIRAKKARAKAKVRVAHQTKARLDHANHETHNEAARAQSRSAYPLETGTRKSSRGAANRAKTDSALRTTVTVRTSSSELRATRPKEGGGRQKSR